MAGLPSSTYGLWSEGKAEACSASKRAVQRADLCWHGHGCHCFCSPGYFVRNYYYWFLSFKGVRLEYQVRVSDRE